MFLNHSSCLEHANSLSLFFIYLNYKSKPFYNNIFNTLKICKLVDCVFCLKYVYLSIKAHVIAFIDDLFLRRGYASKELLDNILNEKLNLYYKKVKKY